MASLDAGGIQTNVYYPMPLTAQAGYRGAAFALPVAEHVSRHIMALPMYPEIPEEYVRTTAAAINAFHAANRGQAPRA